MTVLAVSEAAERLGVSTRQVQHLVARGDLRQVARGVLDERRRSSDCSQYVVDPIRVHGRRRPHGVQWRCCRALTPSGLGETQRSRLRARLGALGASDLVERARERAEVTRYAAHSSAGQYLAAELVYAADVAGRLGLAATNNIDGYLAAADVVGFVSRHGLIRDDEGRVTLRATSMDLEVIRGLVQRSVVFAALDLAESLDVRERRAGLDALDRALESFRG